MRAVAGRGMGTGAAALTDSAPNSQLSLLPSLPRRVCSRNLVASRDGHANSPALLDSRLHRASLPKESLSEQRIREEVSE